MSRPRRAFHRSISRATPTVMTLQSPMPTSASSASRCRSARRRGRALRAAAPSRRRRRRSRDRTARRRRWSRCGSRRAIARPARPTSSTYGRRGGGAVYGSPGAGAGDRVEDAGGVADRAGEHELVGERAPVLAEVGTERRAGARRLQPDDAAHARGEADRAAHVVAVRDGDEPGRDRGRRSAARSARASASRSHGLCVAPYASGSVVMLVASSGVLVLPTNTKPAARKRCASQVSSVSIQFASFSGAHARRGTDRPRCGTPRPSRGTARPRTGRSSRRGASARACSKRRWITAFSCGSTRSMRAIAASTSSAALTLPSATSSACAVASRNAKSSVTPVMYEEWTTRRSGAGPARWPPTSSR